MGRRSAYDHRSVSAGSITGRCQARTGLHWSGLVGISFIRRIHYRHIQDLCEAQPARILLLFAIRLFTAFGPRRATSCIDQNKMSQGVVLVGTRILGNFAF